jgi:hypothetical protein
MTGSNEVFSPIIGGNSAEDIRAGRVANLSRPDYPGRNTLMKPLHGFHLVGLHPPRHALDSPQVLECR